MANIKLLFIVYNKLILYTQLILRSRHSLARNEIELWWRP